MSAPIRKTDLYDMDIVDAYELASDGLATTPASVYMTTTSVSTTSGTQTIVSTLPSDGEGLLTSDDHPVQVGDLIYLTGSSGADGTYTVASIPSDTSVTVVEAIASSTGGTLTWVYPVGAGEVGYNPTGRTWITSHNVQGALTQLDSAISSASPVKTGTTIINFGAYPGASDATVTVTGQTGILLSSVVEAWITPIATSDHSVDEHRVEEIQADADTIVAGTGFTIFARTRNDRIYGQWSVSWMWH